MDSIVAQIQTFVKAADEDGRLTILKTLQQVQDDLQSPQEILMGLANSNLAIAVARLGADLGLFQSLARTDVPLSVDQLAESSGASAQLLERILRYLASKNMIKEVGANQYAAGKITYVLAETGGEALVYHGFDNLGPVFSAIPDFFAENKYQDVTGNTHTPFQEGFNTKLTPFEWLEQHPKNFECMQKVMTAMEGSEWLKDFDLIDREARKISSSPSQAREKAFFVDVGGGYGHQCIQLLKKYPNLQGRLVLQDLPEAVGKLSPIEGIKIEAYDFFQKQPITGAKFYHLRRVIHDWPDDKAVEILRNMASAMAPDSRILIDDAVLPNTGANWQATLGDLLMMGFGGRERTEHQWATLVKLAGMRIEHTHAYVASTYTSVLVLALE